MSMIACYAKCTPCQFGECPGVPHTWMESEDIEHDNKVSMPKTPEDWKALAKNHPCGCHCMRGVKS